MLGDCCGPDCWYETVRQQLSSYSWGHYGDLDPRETKHPPLPGSVMRVLEAARGVGLRTLSGPAIDVGCSVGRTAFELAAESDDLVLGVDVHVAMLRLAHRVLRRGIVTYPRKRVGLVYDRREFSARFEHHENVDFWACDATELPFSDGTFAAAVNLNVLDSVRSPVDLITNVARLMRPGGRVLFSSPYDWSCVVTPLESWLGGHSQRGPHHGSAEPILRALLTPGAHPQSVKQLRIVAERDDVPWTVRIHERSTVSYKLHVIVAEAVESPRVADAASVRESDQD
jgi:SAM-dependent methyltransferase